MTPDGLEVGTLPKSDRAAVQVDAANAIALRGQKRLHLSPRAFAVLDYLVTRAGKLVKKDDLHKAVWRGASNKKMPMRGEWVAESMGGPTQYRP